MPAAHVCVRMSRDTFDVPAHAGQGTHWQQMI